MSEITVGRQFKTHGSSLLQARQRAGGGFFLCWSSIISGFTMAKVGSVHDHSVLGGDSFLCRKQILHGTMYVISASLSDIFYWQASQPTHTTWLKPPSAHYFVSWRRLFPLPTVAFWFVSVLTAHYKLDSLGLQSLVLPTAGCDRQHKDYHVTVTVLHWLLRCALTRLFGILQSCSETFFIHISSHFNLSLVFYHVPIVLPSWLLSNQYHSVALRTLGMVSSHLHSPS